MFSHKIHLISTSDDIVLLDIGIIKRLGSDILSVPQTYILMLVAKISVLISKYLKVRHSSTLPSQIKDMAYIIVCGLAQEATEKVQF